MEEDKLVIKNADGTEEHVSILRIMDSEKEDYKYMIYSKNEGTDVEGERVIYVTKLFNSDGKQKIDAITDDEEWLKVQGMLKNIVNS